MSRTSKLSNDEFIPIYQYRSNKIQKKYRKDMIQRYFNWFRHLIILIQKNNHISQKQSHMNESTSQIHQLFKLHQLCYYPYDLLPIALQYNDFVGSEIILKILNNNYQILSNSSYLINTIANIIHQLLYISSDCRIRFNVLCALKMILEYQDEGENIINFYEKYKKYIVMKLIDGVQKIAIEQYLCYIWIIIDLCRSSQIINLLFQPESLQQTIHFLLKISHVSMMCKLHSYQIILIGFSNRFNIVLPDELIQELFLNPKFSIEQNLSEYQDQLMFRCVVFMEKDLIQLLIQTKFIQKCIQVDKYQLANTIYKKFKNHSDIKQYKLEYSLMIEDKNYKQSMDQL